MSDFDRQDRLYRERVARRRAALKLAQPDLRSRRRLSALRRLRRPCCGYYPECEHVLADLERRLARPRPNRRPALVLALVFLVLALALLCVAKASGGPSGITRVNSGHSALRESPDFRADFRADRRHRIRSAICSVFTGSRCGPAVRVATCETGGTLDPHARGSLGERGLFQIHPIHFRTFNPRRLFEVLYNVRAAFRLSAGGRDWSPWTCQP